MISLYIKGGLFLLKWWIARFPKTIGYNTDTLTSFSGIDNVSILRIKDFNIATKMWL